jgi:hypothetical protein
VPGEIELPSPSRVSELPAAVDELVAHRVRKLRLRRKLSVT